MNGMNMAAQLLSVATYGNQPSVKDGSLNGSVKTDFNELLLSLFEASQDKEGLIQDNAMTPFSLLMNLFSVNNGSLELNGTTDGSMLTEAKVEELLQHLNNSLNSSSSTDTSADLLLALQKMGLVDPSQNPKEQFEEVLKLFHQDNYPNLSKDKHVLLRMLSEKIASLIGADNEGTNANSTFETPSTTDLSTKDSAVRISHLQANMNWQSVLMKENDSNAVTAPESSVLTDEGQLKIMGSEPGNGQNDFTGNAQGKELGSNSPANSLLSNNSSFDRLLQTNSSTVWNQENIQEEMESFIQRHLTVSKLTGSGISEARISLFPEQLGQVDVKIVSHNGVVTAQLVTETGFGRELIESQIQQLRNNLSNQGIVVDKIEVSQGSVLSQFDQGKRHQQQQWTGENSSGGKKHKPEKISAYDSGLMGLEEDSLYSLQRKPYAYSSVEFSA